MRPRLSTIKAAHFGLCLGPLRGQVQRIKVTCFKVNRFVISNDFQIPLKTGHWDKSSNLQRPWKLNTFHGSVSMQIPSYRNRYKKFFFKWCQATCPRLKILTQWDQNTFLFHFVVNLPIQPLFSHQSQIYTAFDL